MSEQAGRDFEETSVLPQRSFSFNMKMQKFGSMLDIQGKVLSKVERRRDRALKKFNLKKLDLLFSELSGLIGWNFAGVSYTEFKLLELVVSLGAAGGLVAMCNAALPYYGELETCIARRGKHWRQSRYATASLSKKKGASHGHGHGRRSYRNGGSNAKPKPPPQSHKATTPSPLPSPKPNEEVIPSIPTPYGGYSYGPQSSEFNVLDFGAQSDAETDDTKTLVIIMLAAKLTYYGSKQAFQDAWAAACKVEASTVVVPAEFVFLVGPISFSGPYCQANIVFQLDGTIIAPTDSRSWGKGILQWLEFSKLKGITIQGKGIIDGRGSVWWQDAPYEDPYDDEWKLIVPLNNTIRNELSWKMPSIKPTALRFYGSFNATVTGITIQNSPLCHLKFDNCMGVVVHDIIVSSPGDSPNTDGIHLQNSNDVLIHSSDLDCARTFCFGPKIPMIVAGDDCVSIQTGCSNIYIHNVNCGPGHGISIGSLGRDNTKACVSNVTVRDVIMHNTMNGVRIKTWQGGSGSVQGVLFSNIQVSEVQLPIVIDQFYCDKRTCSNETTAVPLSGITYEKIKGTYTVKPVHFACSNSLPCVGVTLTSIELKPLQERYHLYDPFCWQTFGELTTPTVPPIGCLQNGKPANNRVQSDNDAC
ncbi:pantothenate kinase 2-like [Hibiscus syriacus]|uniref:Pantothenate kinase 2-like n=1 Tax=Hibiscus syriacus TaxID=106335 RepID=A0A6A3CSP4_HIBSY|nr:pantothenate kinase 2-like [Hibiscus syriacus]